MLQPCELGVGKPHYIYCNHRKIFFTRMRGRLCNSNSNNWHNSFLGPTVIDLYALLWKSNKLGMTSKPNLYFSDEEMEAQRETLTCSKKHSWLGLVRTQTQACLFPRKHSSPVPCISSLKELEPCFFSTTAAE